MSVLTHSNVMRLLKSANLEEQLFVMSPRAMAFCCFCSVPLFRKNAQKLHQSSQVESSQEAIKNHGFQNRLLTEG